MSPTDGLSLVNATLPVATALISAAAGLLGVWAGYRASDRHARAERASRFVERQIEEFYSPLVGLLEERQARADIWMLIVEAANRDLEELPQDAEERAMRTDQHVRLGAVRDERAQELLASVEMILGLFRDKLWLAENSTRRHYATLFRNLELATLVWKDAFPEKVDERVSRAREAAWGEAQGKDELAEAGEDAESELPDAIGLLPLYDDSLKILRQLRSKLSSQSR